MSTLFGRASTQTIHLTHCPISKRNKNTTRTTCLSSLKDKGSSPNESLPESMVVKGVLKLSILGGAIYATQKAGIWGDSTQTTDNIKAYITTNPTLKYYCTLAPSRKELGMKAVDCWNDGVKATFKHLLNTPEYSKQAASWCINAVSGMMEEPKAPPADVKKPSQ